MGGKFTDFARYPVVKPGPDGKQNVALADRSVCRVASVYSDISNVEVVGCGNGPLSHNGGDNGNTRRFGQPLHFILGAADDNAPANEEYGLFGAIQYFCGFF